MKEITDPALLAELEGGSGEVTDPALLAELEGAPQGKSLSGFGQNIARNAGELATGLGNLAVGAATHPIDTGKAVIQSLPGTLKQMAADYGVNELLAGDVTGSIERIGETAYNNPVSTALDIIPATGALGKAGKASVTGAEKIAGKVGQVGDWFGERAANQAIKAIGPTTTNLEELGGMLGGPKGVRDAGHYLLDKGVVTSGAKAEDMTSRLQALSDASGKKIGEWRDTADLRSLGENKPRPTALEIEREIRARLESKYGSGAESGQAGELEKAIAELRKVAPQQMSTTGEEVAQALANRGGGPREVPLSVSRPNPDYTPVPDTIDVPTVAQISPNAGQLKAFDGDFLSEFEIGKKTSPVIQQTDEVSGQLGLFDDPQELFPSDPSMSRRVIGQQTVPVGGQSRVPSLSGQQDLMPIDPMLSQLVETTKQVPNPAFKSSAPSVTRTESATQYPYEDVRAMQEATPELTDGFPYVVDTPLFSELAGTATRLNEAAKNARRINQPDGAMTDAANILSEKSTEGIESFLKPSEQGAYAADRAEFGLNKGLEKVTGRTQYRDMGGANTVPMSKLGIVARGVDAIAPHSRVAAYSDKVSRMLRSAPQMFGRNAQALQEAAQKGGNALAVTTYMLQQRDPEFRETMRKIAEEDNAQ